MPYIRLSEDEIQYILDNVEKKSTREMAEWIGCHITAVWYHLKKKGKQPMQFSKWSPTDRQELLELYKQGLSHKEIAEITKVSLSAIRGQFQVMRRKGIEIPTYAEVAKLRKKKQ